MVAAALATAAASVAQGFGVLQSIAPIAGTVAGIQQSESAKAAAAEQNKLLKEQQDEQKREINKQKGVALQKRKDLLMKQRRQLVGAGDAVTSLTNTSEVGVLPSADSAVGGTLTGGVLG